MTNFEKYKEEIEKLENKYSFTLDLDGNVVNCNNIGCYNCKFQGSGTCKNDRINWLFKEYKEPILSDDELDLVKAFCKVAGINYKYVARDTCGVIGFFEIKPRVNKLGNYYSEYGYTYVDIVSRDKSGDKVLFLPDITHKDGLYDIENKCFIKTQGDD